MKTTSIITAFLLSAHFAFAQSPPIKLSDSGSDPNNTTNKNTDTVTRETGHTIEFFGDASIQKSLNSGDAIPANTGIGVLYKEIFDQEGRWKLLQKIELEISLNIASTVDTLKTTYDSKNSVSNVSDFGNSILLPLNSGQAFNIAFKCYFSNYNLLGKSKKGKFGKGADIAKNKKDYGLAAGFISGLYFNCTGSNRNWMDSTKIIKASTLSMQAGIFHEFLPPDSRNDYSITLGVGFTGRWLLGDIGQNENDTLRSRFLSSKPNEFIKNTFFPGLEFILGFRLKNIKAGVRIPILNTGLDPNVAGLTGVQPNTYILFTGGFPLSLK